MLSFKVIVDLSKRMCISVSSYCTFKFISMSIYAPSSFMLSSTHCFAGFGLFTRLLPSQLGRKNFQVSITFKRKFLDLTVVKAPSLERKSFLQDLPCLHLSATSAVQFGSTFVMEIEHIHGNRIHT